MKEGPTSAREELNTENALLLGRVNDEGASAGSAENHAAVTLEAASMPALVDADGVFAQVEDDASFAVGHELLLGVALRCALPVPEAGDEALQQSAWAMERVVHGRMIVHRHRLWIGLRRRMMDEGCFIGGLASGLDFGSRENRRRR